jgi:Concanavalin A-like lectin/glucanases superfamily/Domain of unknown function (DUF2341)
MRIPINSVIFITIIVLNISCVQNVSQGGGGSEVEVTGCVLKSTNTPAPLTQVKLIPQDYNPIIKENTENLRVDTSDATGHYSFKNVTHGVYNIQAIQLTERTRMLIPGIEIGEENTVVPTDSLHAPGTLKLLLPYSTNRQGYAAIPGTDITTTIAIGSEDITLDSLPDGILTSIIYNINGETKTREIRNVRVISSETTVIADTSWKYKQPIILNTSVSGADISSTIYEFPVLVRLTAANFDFDLIQNSGTEIRFTSSKGARLNHEIERWDSIGEKAEIWVKVDTIFGNNDTQSIIMYWGNPDAADISSSQSVFDTASGFEGVWHLNETNNNNEAIDATPNHLNGNAYQMTIKTPPNGAIGYARSFDGAAGYISMPNTASSKLNFSENDTFTLSAWVYADTFDNVYRTIAAKGYQQYFLQLSYFPSGKPLWQFSTYYQQDNWHMSDFTATARTWVLLTSVKLGSLHYLYCNSELVDNTTNIYAHPETALNRDTTDDFSIGRFMKEANYPAQFGYCYYKGMIDEVRVSSVARSADWIRLSYMNQRSNDLLVQFK